MEVTVSEILCDQVTQVGGFIAEYKDHLTQPLSKRQKIVEMGKKLTFSKTQAAKPLYKYIYKSMKKSNNLFFYKTVWQIFLNISRD